MIFGAAPAPVERWAMDPLSIDLPQLVEPRPIPDPALTRCPWCEQFDCPEAFEHGRLYAQRETSWRETKP